MRITTGKKLTMGALAAVLALGIASAYAQTVDGDVDPDAAASDVNGESTDAGQPTILTYQNNDDGGDSDVSDDPGVDGDPDTGSDAVQNTGLRTSSDPFGAGRAATLDDDTSVAGNPRARQAEQVGTIGPDGRVTPLANTRAVPEQGAGTINRIEPYSPLGVRLGTFTLFSTVTQTLGYTTNADAAAGGSASAFSLTDVRLNAVSNWSVHELRAGLGGSYQTFFAGDSDDLPTMDANIDLRLDHNRGFTSRFGASYAQTTESAVSDNLTVPPPLTVTDRPDVRRYAAYGEIANQSGRLNTRLRGTVTYSQFDRAALSNGTSLSQSDRANTFYELRSRAGYEISPAFQPFVEASIGARRYSQRVDRNGNVRDSLTYGLRGGVAFDRGEKLNGEIAVGYTNESFEDAAINDLGGVTVDAAVNWSPMRLTTISGTAQTAFTGSTNANEAGSVTYTGTLGVVHDIRPSLSLSASVLASIQDFDSGRQDTVLQAQAGVEWRWNRNLAVIGSVGHDITRSSDAGSSYSATTARLGMRWRH